MALKGDRFLGITEVSYFMDQVAENGGVVVLKTAGSGAALDQQAAEVEYVNTTPSGSYPVGLLLNNMVNLDLTRTHMNFQKNDQQKGSKVPLLRDGWVVTNMLYAPTGVLHVPVAGQKAYLAPSGLLTIYPGANLEYPAVGRFESTLDEDGYVKVYIKLPSDSHYNA